MENTKQMNCQCDSSKSKSRVRNLIDLLIVVALVLLIVKMLFMSEWWYEDKKYKMMWRWGCDCSCITNSWESSCGVAWCSDCSKDWKWWKSCGMMWMMKNMIWDDDKKENTEYTTWVMMTWSMTGM